MGLVDGTAVVTVMVKLVTSLPVSTDTAAGFSIGCWTIMGRNELLAGFRYPRTSGTGIWLALWLQAVPASVVARTKAKTTFNSS
jgi:hypothetical protein